MVLLNMIIMAMAMRSNAGMAPLIFMWCAQLRAYVHIATKWHRTNVVVAGRKRALFPF